MDDSKQAKTAECRYEANQDGGTLHIEIAGHLIRVPVKSKIEAHQLLGSAKLREILKSKGVNQVAGYFWGDQGC